jgi:pentapeptide MXKDX repeat protein
LKAAFTQQELTMRKTILAAICATAIGATPFAAFAQATGPSGQDSTKMGTAPMSKDGESKATGTQGMSKDSMKKDSIHKDGMKKDNMMKNEMKK